MKRFHIWEKFRFFNYPLKTYIWKTSSWVHYKASLILFATLNWEFFWFGAVKFRWSLNVMGFDYRWRIVLINRLIGAKKKNSLDIFFKNCELLNQNWSGSRKLSSAPGLSKPQRYQSYAPPASWYCSYWAVFSRLNCCLFGTELPPSFPWILGASFSM